MDRKLGDEKRVKNQEWKEYLDRKLGDEKRVNKKIQPGIPIQSKFFVESQGEKDFRGLEFTYTVSHCF